MSEEYQRKNIEFWYNHARVCNDIQKGAYTHIALAGSNVAGVIGGGMTGSDTAEIFVLYVDETYRYKGIGTLLLDALTKEHRKNGASRQCVSVEEDNQYGIPFYESRGFLCQGRETLTETGEQHVSLRYARSLK
nr:GNAT family N-acetyltransferase [Lentibacillus sediminis]